MIKQEEFPTPSKKFDCREDVNPLSCKKCGFSSHMSPSIIQHKEAGCANNVDKSRFLLDAYKCRKCEFVSCSYIITSRHETKCHLLDDPSASITSLWICSHCEFTVSYKSLGPDDKYECGDHECNYTYTRMEELKQHATFVHLPDECLIYFFANDGVGKKGCARGNCGEEFKKKFELDRHRMDTHALVEGISEECETLDENWLFCHACAYKSKQKFRLREHIMNKHFQTPVVYIQWFERQECDYKAITVSQLYSHKYTTREGIKWFECQQCDFKSKGKRELNQHTISKHTPRWKIKWFECQECSFKGKTKNSLYKHKIRQHSENIKWFNCEKCEFKSKTKEGLSLHRIDKHTPSENIKWFKCHQCSYKSKRKYGLNRHKMNKHTSSGKIRWFECEECEFKSKANRELNQHKISKHTPTENIKWFECQQCDFKAKTKASLRAHKVKKHAPADKIKWFECHHCGYKNKNKFDLRQHAIKAHMRQSLN